MSRIKRFAHSLVSGYVALVANIFYTLASVPLAFHYLPKAEFGLWAVVTQIAGYITLIDFGMGTSVARILIDHKDDRQNGAYGSVIKTGVLVGAVQGTLIILAGAGLSVLAGSLLHIPADLRKEFLWLMIGQSALLAITFVTRIFNILLQAHQLLAINYYGNSVMFFASLAGMWAGLAAGFGVYSFLIGLTAMNLGNIVVSAVACLWLKLLPQRHEWGKISRQRFWELFSFGRDIFLYSVGNQLISASQTILLTRLLGLETAAAWTVGTRAYLVLTQAIYQIFGFAAPALAEMMVRGEKEKLCHRFQQIAVLSVNLAFAAGAMFALCNSTFVAVWVKNKIAWPPVNDVLLAVWLVVCAAMRVHTNLVGQTKKFRFMRFLFFIEGLAFVGLTLAIYRFGGIKAMLSASILCTLSFSLPYGLYRTREYFGLSWRELMGWFEPLLRLLLWLAPAGALLYWLTADEPALLRLLARGAIFGLWITWVFLRHGLPTALKMEIYRRFPDWGKPVFAWVGFGKSHT